MPLSKLGIWARIVRASHHIEQSFLSRRRRLGRRRPMLQCLCSTMPRGARVTSSAIASQRLVAGVPVGWSWVAGSGKSLCADARSHAHMYTRRLKSRGAPLVPRSAHDACAGKQIAAGAHRSHVRMATESLVVGRWLAQPRRRLDRGVSPPLSRPQADPWRAAARRRERDRERVRSSFADRANQPLLAAARRSVGGRNEVHGDRRNRTSGSSTPGSSRGPIVFAEASQGGAWCQ